MKRLLFLCCTVSVSVLYGQQTPLFTLYRDAWAILNPAAMSNNYLLNDRTMSLCATGRFQWWNHPGAPVSQTVQYEWVDEDHNSVWGGQLLNDQTGKIGQTGLYGRYAYRIKTGRRTVKSWVIGLQAGAVQYRAKWSQVEFPDPSTAPQTDDWTIRPDIGVGVFYHYSDRWYAGVSAPQTFGINTRFRDERGVFDIRRQPHVYAVGGWYWNAPWLGNETSFIEPSIWIKYTRNAPLNLDLNARCQISELLWFGTGTSLGLGQQLAATLHTEVGLFLGEQVQLLNSQFKVGFGFDLPLTQGVFGVFGPSGELNVSYAWK